MINQTPLKTYRAANGSALHCSYARTIVEPFLGSSWADITPSGLVQVGLKGEGEKNGWNGNSRRPALVSTMLLRGMPTRGQNHPIMQSRGLRTVCLVGAAELEIRKSLLCAFRRLLSGLSPRNILESTIYFGVERIITPNLPKRLCTRMAFFTPTLGDCTD
jgi:hypothetical protein